MSQSEHTNAKQYAVCCVLPTVGMRYPHYSSSGVYTSGRGAGMNSETGLQTCTAIGLPVTSFLQCVMQGLTNSGRQLAMELNFVHRPLVGLLHGTCFISPF